MKTLNETLDFFIEKWKENPGLRLGQIVINAKLSVDNEKEKETIENQELYDALLKTELVDLSNENTIHRISLLEHKLRYALSALAKQLNTDNFYQLIMLSSRDTVDLFYMNSTELVSRLENAIR